MGFIFVLKNKIIQLRLRMKNSGFNQERKLFQNPFLEKLTHTNTYVVISVLFLGALIVLGYGTHRYPFNMLSSSLVFVLGLFVFTFVEYVLHRFVYHSGPNYLDPQYWQYTAHGVHHVFSKDKDRLAMPLPLAILLSTLFFFFFKLILGKWVWIFFPGFSMGYTLYLYIHYLVHSVKPPKNFLRYLWHHHLKHHVDKHDHTAFGVSSPLWDWVFGTMPPTNVKIPNHKE